MNKKNFLLSLATLALLLGASCTPKTTPEPSRTPTPTPRATPLPTTPAVGIKELAKFGNGTAESIDVTEDGEYFAVGGSQGVHIYKASTKQELHHFDYGDPIYAVKFSPDGSLLILYSVFDLRIIRIMDGETLLRLGDGDPIGRDFRLSTDNTTFAYRWRDCANFDGCDSNIHVWDLPSKTEKFTLALDYTSDGLRTWQPQLLTFELSPDGKKLIAGSSDNQIYIWDLSSGELENKLKGHVSYIKDVAVSSDGRLVASAGNDNTVRLWNLTDGKYLRTFSGLILGTATVEFGPNGNSLKIATEEGAVEWRDIDTGNEILPPPESSDPLPGIQQFVKATAGYQGRVEDIFFGSDKQTLITFDKDTEQILIWDIPANAIQTRIETPASAITCNKAGTELISSDTDGYLRFWDTKSGDKIREIRYEDFAEKGYDPELMVLSGDENLLAVNGVLYIDIWDLRTGKILLTLFPSEEAASALTDIFQTDSMAFSADGTRLNTILAGSEILQSWNLTDGSLAQQFAPSEPKSVVVKGDLVLLDYGYLEIRDLSTGQLMHHSSQPAGTQGYHKDATSPDGQLLLFLYENKVQFLDASSGQVLYEHPIHEDILTVAFSSDGLQIALGTSQSILVWDVSQIVQAAQRIPTSTPDQRPTPTSTSTPTATAMATLPGQYSLPLTPAPIPDTAPQAITQENAVSLVEIARIGKGTIQDSTWSADGKNLAIASPMGVYIYDPDNWELKQFIESPLTFTQLFYLPDGRLFGIGPSNAIAEVWDILNQRKLSSPAGGYDLLDSPRVAVSVDGQKIAIVDTHAFSLQIFDVINGAKIADLRGFYGDAICFSPDGTQIAGAFTSNSLEIVDLATGRVPVSLGGPGKGILDVSFSHDGKKIAATAEDGTFWIWDAQSGQTLVSITDIYRQDSMDSPLEWFTSLNFSPDDRQLALGSTDGAVRVLDVETGEIIRTVHGLVGAVIQTSFSPDGALLAGIDRFSTLRTWRTADGSLEHTLQDFSNDFQGIQFQKNGDLAAWYGSQLWDINPDAGKLRDSLDLPSLKILAISHDGHQLAVENSGAMQIWNSNPLKPVTTLSGTPELLWYYNQSASYYGFYRAEFNDSDQALAASGSGGFWLWDLSTSNEPILHQQISEMVYDFRLTPDRQYLVLVHANPLAYFLADSISIGLIGSDFHYFNELQEEYSTFTVSQLSSSPDQLLIAATTGHASIWETKNGNPVATLKPDPNKSITGLAFSPDQKLLAIGDDHGQLTFYDTSTFTPIATLDEGDASIDNLTFSGNGRYLAATRGDGTVSIWGLP